MSGIGGILSGIGSAVDIAGGIADLFRNDSSGSGLIPPDPYKGLISTDAFRFGSGALARTNDIVDQERRLLGLTGNLRESATPGFGQLTQTGIEAIRQNAGQAAGNLRASLAQRGLSGASFANDAVGRVARDFQQQEDQFRAQAFQAEFEANLKAIQQEQSILAQQAQRELGELGIATSFLAQVNQTILSQAEALAAAASQNIIANLPPLQGGAGGTTPLPGGGGGGGTGGGGGGGNTAATQPGAAVATPGNVNQGGEISDPGGEGGRGNQASSLAAGLQQTPQGYAPGYQEGLDVIGTILGLGIPGAGLAASGINAGLGTQAANQSADLMSQITGQPVNLTAADYLNAATAGGPFGVFSDSPYGQGLGGYGQIGIGGTTGQINMLDPGVMGAPRAQAATIVAENQPGLAPTTALAAPAKVPTAAQISAAMQGAFVGLGREERIVAKRAFEQSVSNLTASGTLNASTLSQAAQLAKSGKSMKKGTPGVSGSQIAGGQTVGNNPNDTSGRNPGAPSQAGAGGRLGGGV